MKKILAAGFSLFIFFLQTHSYAGGPFAVDVINDSGVALRWKNDTMNWYLDPGRVSNSVENSTGKDWVNEALDTWRDITIPNAEGEPVKTSTFKSHYEGNLPADVTSQNSHPYLSASSGVSSIIFDEDGDITAKLLGASNRATVVGLSAPLLSDYSGLYITKGFALFNGYVLDDGKLAPESDVAKKLFKATILHEIGHMINLDHSQVNDSIAQECGREGTLYTRGGECGEKGKYIPTMYPELLTFTQGALSMDDRVTVSWIYPSTEFQSDFCLITGEIFDADGKPLKGVNVIASRADVEEDIARTDSRSFVSGVLHSGCKGGAKYYLYGILPGVPYQVSYEPINSAYTGTSGFEPNIVKPSGFEAGIITSSSGASTVKCSKGGNTIEMASATIDTPNPCASENDDSNGDGSNPASAESSTSCSFSTAGGAVGTAAFLFISIITAMLASDFVRRRREKNA